MSSASFASPVGMHVIGGYGYVFDSARLRRVDLATGEVSTVAGNGTGGSVDSTNPALVRLNGAGPMADDGTFLYFTNTCGGYSEYSCLRKLTLSSGAVTTLAQRSIYSKYTGLMLGGDGALYGATGNTVERINTSTGSGVLVGTISGTSAVITSLSADQDALWMSTNDGRLLQMNPSTGASQTLVAATVVGVTSVGSYLYGITSTEVRRFAKSDGSWVSVAGAPSSAGYLNGTGSQAWFNQMNGVDADSGALYVSDAGNRRIRKLVAGTALSRTQPPALAMTAAVSPATVSTLAGNGANGVVDGAGTTASFAGPVGLHIVGGFGYVLDSGYLRRVDLGSGVVSTVAGSGTYGSIDSTDPALARLGGTGPMTDDGTFLYFTNTCGGYSEYSCLRRMSLSTGAIATIAQRNSASAYQGLTIGPDGALYGVSGNVVERIDTVNNTVSTAVTVGPTGTTMTTLTADGSYLWAATTDQRILKIDLSTGGATPLPGTQAVTQLVSAGTYLYGASGTEVRRIAKADGTWVSIAGTPASAGYVEGTGGNAWFSGINAVSTDGTTVYVNDKGNRRIRKLVNGAPLPAAQTPEASLTTSISPALVTAFAGAASPGLADATGPAARFTNPAGMHIAGGYGYVFDSGYLRRVNLTTGAVTTVAGTGVYGYTDNANPSLATLLGSGPMTDDGSFLYFTGTCGAYHEYSCLRRMSLSTGAIATLKQQSTYSPYVGLVIGPDGALYGSVDNRVDRIDTVSDTVSTFATITPQPGSTRTSATSLAADGSDLWLSSKDTVCGNLCGDGQTVLWRIPFATAQPAVWATNPVLTQEQIGGKLVSAGAYLYGTYISALQPNGTTFTGIARWSKAQPILEPIASFTSGGTPDGSAPTVNTVTGLDKIGNTLFATDASTTTIYKLEQEPAYLGQYGPHETTGGGNPAEANSQTSTAEPVNTYSGELHDTVTDLALGGRAPVVANRTYSSQLAGTSGMFGYGWTSPWEASLVPTGSDLLFRQENGSQVTFHAVAGGYQAPANVRETLTHNPSTGTYTVTRRHDTNFTFDPAGQLIAVTDRNGETTTLTRSSTSLQISSADGRQLTYTLDGQGRAVTLAGPGGRQVHFHYSTAGDLDQVTDARGKIWSYGYDSNHLQTSFTEPSATSSTVTVFDSSQRVVRQTTPAGGVTTFAYTTSGASSTTRVTDPAGVVTLFRYRYGLQFSRTLDPDGQPARWLYTYTTNGEQTSVTDPTGQLTQASYDSDGNVLTRTDGAGNITQFSYDSNGDLLTATDPAGHTRTWTYDSHGNVIRVSIPQSASVTSITRYDRDPNHPADILTVTDPDNRTSTSTYTAEGFVQSQTAGDGGKTTWTYNPYGQVLTTVSPKGNASGATAADYTTTATYDSGGLPLTITDPLGHLTRYAQDDAGRRVSVTDANNNTTTLSYNSDSTLASSSDPLQHITRFTYDPAGRLLSTTAPDGGVTTRTYDSHGWLATLTKPTGNAPGATTADKTARSISYGYDLAGRLLSASQPDPDHPGQQLTSTTSYDNAGRVHTTTNPAGETTTFGYDTLGRTTTVTDPRGKTTSYGYDWDLDRTSSTDPLQHTTTSSYTAGRLLVSTVDPLGNAVRYSYDPVGRLQTTVDPRGTCPSCTAANYTSTVSYDLNGNTTAITDQLGHATSYGYDHADRRTSSTDANNHTTSYGYDNLNRLVTVTAPDGGITTYGYDAASERISTKNPRGNTWTYAYDPNGRPISSSDPLQRTRTVGYDLDGNPTTQLSARATSSNPALGTTTNTYDPVGRLTGVSYGDGAAAVAYGYDQASRRSTMTDAAGTQTYGYDTAGRVTSMGRIGSPGWGYTYNDDNTPATLTRPDGSVESWTYDAAARPASRTTPAGTTTYAYDPAGQLLTSSQPNGTVETQSYDRAGQLATIGTSRAGTALVSQTITRDLTGKPSQIAVSRGNLSETRAFLYDPNDRLSDVCYLPATACTGPSAATQAWTYDLAGNRTSEKNGVGPLATTTSYSYDTADELTSRTITSSNPLTPPTTNSYTYDADGNQLTDGTTSWTYDLNNRSTSSTTAGNTTQWLHDGDGTLLQQTTASSTIAYDWNLASPVPQLASVTSGGTTQSYRYDPLNRPDTTSQGSTTDTLAHDPIGSTTDLINSTGSITRSYDYTPFGTDRAAIGAPTAGGLNSQLTYAGMLNTGPVASYITRDRNYDPSNGRWTATDPVAAGAGTPFDSSYSYVTNQPGLYTDPLGQSACDHLFGLCASAQFAGNVVVGVGQGAKGAAESLIHPIRTLHSLQNACNQGFDSANNGGGPSFDGFLQCVDNLNPVAGIRRDLTIVITSPCPAQAAKALGRAEFSTFLLAAPLKGLGATGDVAEVTATAAAGGAKLSGRTVLGESWDDAIRAARGAKGEAGFFDVIGHGTPSSVFDAAGNAMSPSQLAGVIRGTPSWGGQPVRLLSCSTGCPTGSFAQSLANELGVVVKAPTTDFLVNSRGGIVLDPGGSWRMFYPG